MLNNLVFGFPLSVAAHRRSISRRDLHVAMSISSVGRASCRGNTAHTAEAEPKIKDIGENPLQIHYDKRDGDGRLGGPGEFRHYTVQSETPFALPKFTFYRNPVEFVLAV